jgi:hypothetical protein
MKFRLWRLGSLEHKIYPTREHIEKFKEALKHSLETGEDLVWGPEISYDLIEVDDVQDFILTDNVKN